GKLCAVSTSREGTGAPGRGERVGENEKLVARVSRLSIWHFRQLLHRFILDNPPRGRPAGRLSMNRRARALIRAGGSMAADAALLRPLGERATCSNTIALMSSWSNT